MLKFVAAVALLLAATFAALARPIHIVAFGDSATDGWLVARKDAYPAQLQALLRKKGYDVTVANAGVPGDTTRGALHRFDQAIGPDTDIAIVEFGTNDLRQRVPIRRCGRVSPRSSRALRARRIEVLVIGLGHLKLDDVARAQGVAYAQWTLPPGKYRARDHAHYNAQGYAIVVGRMLPQVEALMKRIKERPAR